MTDILERLRNLRYVHVPVASGLMEEAAAEIERLRNSTPCPHVRGTVTQHCALNFTLTDEEREAIECFATAEWTSLRWSQVEKNCNTLRSLLARLAVE
jgi:hypothetical protein